MSNAQYNCLVIFFHIEKCGGTSLLESSRQRSGFRHCDIISSKRLGNVADVCDFRRSLAMYPNCDFITGHCLYPELIEEYKNVVIARKKQPIVITSTRDPVERLLSDYAHARRRGEVMMLDQYSQIPFKRNYICNFWGGGNIEVARRRLNNIDHVVKVGELDRFGTFLNANHELGLGLVSKRNSSRVEALPEDLSVEGGVRVGKYRIDRGLYENIALYNKDDIRLLREIDHWVPEPSDSRAPLKKSNSDKAGKIFPWLYRNLWYKPRMQRSFGRLYEKRNSVPHRLDGDIAYMWKR